MCTYVASQANSEPFGNKNSSSSTRRSHDECIIREVRSYPMALFIGLACLLEVRARYGRIQAT